MNSETFYETPFYEFTFVPGDIETTGFYDDEIITTFTIEHDGTYLAWLNTDGRDTDADSLEAEMAAESDLDVEVRPCDDDGELLYAVRRYIVANFDREDTIFVFYNGERWNGGFDLRFIRSVCLRTGAPFPFGGYAYLDLLPMFSKHDRFNVTHIDPDPDLDDLFNKGPLKAFADHLDVEYTGSWNKDKIIEAIEDDPVFTDDALAEYCEENDIDAPEVNPGGLVPVYRRIKRLMCERDDVALVEKWSQPDCDPFGADESAKAVQAYHDGEFGDVILHNIADVHKTGLLASLLPETDGAIARNELKPTFF